MRHPFTLIAGSVIVLALVAQTKGTAQTPNVDALVERIRTERNDSVRLSAVHALGQVALTYGPTVAGPAIPALLDVKHNDRNPSVREEATTAIRAIGQTLPAVRHYLTALGSSQERVYAEALNAVAAFVRKASSADQETLAALPVLRVQAQRLFSSTMTAGWSDSLRWSHIYAVIDCVAIIAKQVPRDTSPAIEELVGALVRIAPSRRPYQFNTRAVFNRVAEGIADIGEEGIVILANEIAIVEGGMRGDLFLLFSRRWNQLSASLQGSLAVTTLLPPALEVLNRFPDSWTCASLAEGGSAIVFLGTLGPIAYAALPKLDALAALSVQEARRFGCGDSVQQEAARQAIRRIRLL
jgi:hypothetical protein